MASKSMPRIDEVDWVLLDVLQDEGRVSFTELGRRVGMSAPAVTDRVRRLEQAGVITGYRAVVDPVVLGVALEAIVRVRVGQELVEALHEYIDSLPEVVDCDRVAGEDSTVVRVRVMSLGDLEALVDALGTFGETVTSVVLSSSIRSRGVTRDLVAGEPVEGAGDLDEAVGE